MLKKTKEICKKYDIVPTRSKGQNFLITEDIYDAIVAEAEVNDNDKVLEVGPGLGFLTEKLCEQAKSVVAVELDDKLYDIINYRLKDRKNLQIFNQNVLDMEVKSWELDIENWKIVANLPYNITSVFLRKVFALENQPDLMVLMLQKEVAERIVSDPGKMSLLSLSVALYADAEIVLDVPKCHFWPEPKVDSAVIKIKTREPLLAKDKQKDFFRLIKIAFAQKRKMLKKNLINGYHVSSEQVSDWMSQVKIDEKTRAQELSMEDWLKLLSIIITPPLARGGAREGRRG
jgi:16S rRNA (adenine1518-N6/adenine1519-N6)-dimethyltransferase